jgi:hypothetical protein
LDEIDCKHVFGLFMGVPPWPRWTIRAPTPHQIHGFKQPLVCSGSVGAGPTYPPSFVIKQIEKLLTSFFLQPLVLYYTATAIR